MANQKTLSDKAAHVWQIDETEKDAVYVSFHTSSARHYLDRKHPAFQKMLDTLKAAADKGLLLQVTSTRNDFEIVDVRDLPAGVLRSLQDEEEDDEEDDDQDDVPQKAVTMERATALFDMLLAKTCTPDDPDSPCIPFLYPSSGCWIRAHLMCYFMREQGETPAKVWNDGKLWARSANVKTCIVYWPWHVAATLLVEQPGSEPVLMAFDPSLCNGPVPVDEWRRLQNDLNSTLRHTSWKQYGHYSGKASKKKANMEMEDCRTNLKLMLIDDGPQPYDCSCKPTLK